MRGDDVPAQPHADWLRPDWPLAHVRAFMTTRAGGVSAGAHASLNIGRSVGDDPAHVAANRARVSAALGAPALFMPQVHGAEVLVLGPEHVGVELAPHDAAVSTSPALGVAIQVADCLPVLFAAPRGVAGAHAGWRGLAGGVLENTVAALCREAGCAPDEVQAWFGACIGPTAFEVGADVLAAFGRPAVHADQPLFRYQPNQAGEPRWRADLVGLARERLAAAGVTRTGGGRWCTVGDASFFSYRRERLAGRMVAAIRLV